MTGLYHEGGGAFAPALAREHEQDIVWYHLEAGGSPCGLVCPLGHATGMPPASQPSEQDRPLITGMRMAWIEYAFRAIGRLKCEVLREYYAPAVKLTLSQRGTLNSFSRIGPVLLHTLTLQEWQATHARGHSLMFAIETLVNRRDNGSPAERLAARAVLDEMRREGQGLYRQSCQNYASAREGDPALRKQRRSLLDAYDYRRLDSYLFVSLSGRTSRRPSRIAPREGRCALRDERKGGLTEHLRAYA